MTYADLVVALGSVTRVPPVAGLKEHAFALKDVPDAIRLRNHVLRQIDLADAAPESGAAASRSCSSGRASPAWRRSPSCTS